MMWLACIDGADKGLALKLGEEPVLLGRQIDCDMQLKEKCASRHHCRVTLVGRQLIVEDLGSSNGIKFKGKRYRGDSFKIWQGQGFRIGDDEFAFSEQERVEVQEAIDIGDVAEQQTLFDDAGDSSHMLSDADREELARAVREEKMKETPAPMSREQMREVATKTVWERMTGFIRRD